jgi:hypothetical protein
LLPLLENDLEAPAFSLCPELGELRRRIESQIGQIVRMSGSGSTLFTLADDFEAAKGVAARIRQPEIGLEICELSPNSTEIKAILKRLTITPRYRRISCVMASLVPILRQLTVVVR